MKKLTNIFPFHFNTQFLLLTLHMFMYYILFRIVLLICYTVHLVKIWCYGTEPTEIYHIQRHNGTCLNLLYCEIYMHKCICIHIYNYVHLSVCVYTHTCICMHKHWCMYYVCIIYLVMDNQCSTAIYIINWFILISLHQCILFLISLLNVCSKFLCCLSSLFSFGKHKAFPLSHITVLGEML